VYFSRAPLEARSAVAPGTSPRASAARKSFHCRCKIRSMAAMSLTPIHVVAVVEAPPSVSTRMAMRRTPAVA